MNTTDKNTVLLTASKIFQKLEKDGVIFSHMLVTQKDNTILVGYKASESDIIGEMMTLTPIDYFPEYDEELPLNRSIDKQ